MLEKDLVKLIRNILGKKTETMNIEFKSAKGGAPEKLYDYFPYRNYSTATEELYNLLPLRFLEAKKNRAVRNQKRSLHQHSVARKQLELLVLTHRGDFCRKPLLAVQNSARVKKFFEWQS